MNHPHGGTAMKRLSLMLILFLLVFGALPLRSEVVLVAPGVVVHHPYHRRHWHRHYHRQHPVILVP
jgi:hypothetical protein